MRRRPIIEDRAWVCTIPIAVWREASRGTVGRSFAGASRFSKDRAGEETLWGTTRTEARSQISPDRVNVGAAYFAVAGDQRKIQGQRRRSDHPIRQIGNVASRNLPRCFRYAQVQRREPKAGSGITQDLIHALSVCQEITFPTLPRGRGSE